MNMNTGTAMLSIIGHWGKWLSNPGGIRDSDIVKI